MHTIWSSITSDVPSVAELIDSHTVHQLHGRVPKYSTQDQDAIRSLFETGEAFPKVIDSSLRAKLLRNVLSLDTMILSFKTFFEDAKCLEQIALGLRELSKPGRSDSLEKSFRKIHSGSGQISIQVAEDDFREVSVSPNAAARLGYLQLCLCLIRNFPQTSLEPSVISKRAPKRQKRVPRSASSKANADLPHTLAGLASRIGFDSPQIRKYLKDDTDTKALRACLYTIRPREQFAVDHGKLEAAVERMKQELGIFKPKPTTVQLPEFATEATGEPVNLRYGMPSEASQAIDRQHLYLPTLYTHREHQTRREITSFGAKKFMFSNFFGYDIDLPLASGRTTSFPRNEALNTGGQRDGSHRSVEEPSQSHDPHEVSQYREFGTDDVEQQKDSSSDRIFRTGTNYSEATKSLLNPSLGRYQPEDYIDIMNKTNPHHTTAAPKDSIQNRLARQVQDCRDHGKMAFWKLETNHVTVLDKDDDDSITRQIEAFARGDQNAIIPRQNFVLVANDSIAHVNSTNVLEVSRKEPRLNYPGIIFLVDAPDSEELSPWQMATSEGSFQKAIHFLNGGSHVLSKKRRRIDNTSSSIYSIDTEL